MVTIRSSNDISLCVGEIYTNTEKLRMLKKKDGFLTSLSIFQSPQPALEIYAFSIAG